MKLLNLYDYVHYFKTNYILNKLSYDHYRVLALSLTRKKCECPLDISVGSFWVGLILGNLTSFSGATPINIKSRIEKTNNKNISKNILYFSNNYVIVFYSLFFSFLFISFLLILIKPSFLPFLIAYGSIPVSIAESTITASQLKQALATPA